MPRGSKRAASKISSHPQDLAELHRAVLDRLQPRLDGTQRVHRSARGAATGGLRLRPDRPGGDQSARECVAAHPAGHAGAGPRDEHRRRGARRGRRSAARACRSASASACFEPFERGQTRAPGSGLGLTIARGFVEAHGGKLWLEDAPVSGARFVFTLPVRGGCRVNRPRVLVVDDEPQIRRALRLVLRANGYHVSEAATGEARAGRAGDRAVRPDDPGPDAAGHGRRRGLPPCARVELSCRWWSCRPTATRRSRCARSTRAPTTT